MKGGRELYMEGVVNIVEEIFTLTEPLNQWVRSLLILGVFIILYRPVAKLIFQSMMMVTKRTKTDVDTKVVQSFEKPFRVFLLLLGVFLAVRVMDMSPGIEDVIWKAFRSGLIIIIAWGLANLSKKDSGIFENLASRFRIEVEDILIQFLAKGMRFIVIALTISIVAQEWEYDVNGFVAGLGIGGLAFALAAQDTLANLFGGMVITVDKPFNLDDWIETPSVEGTVEEISFRSTRVRTFAQALVHVPNSRIVKEPITNWSRMGKRRVMFNLGVMYKTPKEKLEICVKRIDEMLNAHSEVDKEFIIVRFSEFSESSLDIFIYCFAQTTQWAEFMRIKEDINFRAMTILAEEGVEVAFPSRSIYMEDHQKNKSQDKEEESGITEIKKS